MSNKQLLAREAYNKGMTHDLMQYAFQQGRTMYVWR